MVTARMQALGVRRAATATIGILLGILVGALLTGVAVAQTGPTTTTSSPPVTTPTTGAPPVTTTLPDEQPSKKSEPATVSPEVRIDPIIECTFVDESTKQTSTVWGYRNRGSSTTVPVGDANHFDNPKSLTGGVGQPTDFKPGRNMNVFVVTATGESTWTLTGNEETSDGKGDKCKTNPVPVVNTGLGGLVALAVVTGVMGLVLFWRMRRPR